MNDVEQGNVQLVSEKSFKDYIVEYQYAEMDDKIHTISNNLGLDEKALRKLMISNITTENINEFNRFSNLLDSVDKEKAKTFFENQEGKSLRPYEVSRKIDKYLRDIILNA